MNFVKHLGDIVRNLTIFCALILLQTLQTLVMFRALSVWNSGWQSDPDNLVICDHTEMVGWLHCHAQSAGHQSALLQEPQRIIESLLAKPIFAFAFIQSSGDMMNISNGQKQNGNEAKSQGAASQFFFYLNGDVINSYWDKTVASGGSKTLCSLNQFWWFSSNVALPKSIWKQKGRERELWDKENRI